MFETGGVVFTKNYCGGLEVQEDDFLATGARSEPVQNLPPQPRQPFEPDVRTSLAETLVLCQF